MKKILLLILVFFMFGYFLVQVFIYENKSTNEPEVWIEVHDVSPAWKYWRLRQVVDIIDEYPSSYSKVVLFVIPNHANITPLHEYPDYTEKLKSLVERGYIIGDHGYNHQMPDFEFYCTLEKAKELLNKSKSEFEKAGLDFPEYFLAPGWEIFEQVTFYVNDEFDYVYYRTNVKSPTGFKDYPSHEYTWYTESADNSLVEAKQDYRKTHDVFRLTVHLGPVNNEEGLKFLDEFLKHVQGIKTKT